MVRDITIGQYYPVNSVLHRLDPRVKLVSTLIYIVSLFVFDSIIGYVIAAIFLASMIKLSQVPFRFMVKGLKPVVVLLCITLFFNLIFTVRMGIRLVFLVIGASLMTLTTTPNQLTDGLERLLKPLNHIHVPVHEISMIMSIALRFIPILLDETDKIMKAQTARGADFESGGLVRKVKAMVPLLVPLFISAFRRANDLAMAMEARCYHGGEGRTQMKPLIYQKRDYVAYGIVWAYLAVSIVFRVLGI